MRQVQLLILTFVYGCFAVWHLSYAKGCELTTVLLFGITALVFIGVMLSICFNKFTRLNIVERMSLLCLTTFVLFFNSYLILCSFSPPDWVWNHNVKSGTFIAITAIFYSYTIYKLNREQQ